MPKLWRGRRRGLLVALGLAGAGQAAAAALTAILTPRLLGVGTRTEQLQLAGLLVAMAVGLGALRVLERVLGERLGQDYVHEVRMHLVRAALLGKGPSVGVTVARTTNDLTSVRNWIVQGVVPLLVGIPMVLGSLVALAMLSPVLSLAVAVPVAILGVVLFALAGPVQRRAAALRKKRGRMAGAITDAVQAAESIVVAGGLERELRRLSDDSREVGEKAVSRAVLTGWMRGAAASIATIAMLVVGSVGALTGVDAATIAAAFIIVGMLATPVTELGKVSEFRQSFRVAEGILAPQVEASRKHRSAEREIRDDNQRRIPRRDELARLHLMNLRLDDHPVPELLAHPGQVVVPHSDDPERVRELVSALLHPETQQQACLMVAGQDLGLMTPLERRDLVGHASAPVNLPRGTIARTVRYRSPDSTASVDDALREVGLLEAVSALDKGDRTSLRRGGEPLDAQQRCRLALARAWYDEPALMVLDHVDRGLDSEGRRLLAEGIRRRRGVTILISEAADELAPGHTTWNLDERQTTP